jgi:hypothetical protein
MGIEISLGKKYGSCKEESTAVFVIYRSIVQIYWTAN